MTYSFCMISPYNSRISANRHNRLWSSCNMCQRRCCHSVLLYFCLSLACWSPLHKPRWKILPLFLLKRLSIFCWYINLLNVWGAMGTQIIEFKQRTAIFVNGSCKEKKAQQQIMSILCGFEDSLCTQKSWCCCFCLPWRPSAVEAFLKPVDFEVYKTRNAHLFVW